MAHIEMVVSEYLGHGRVRGNEAGPCFSRQVSMYLAHSVGGWSTTRIGRFYNGRHHTTVLHAIRKIERQRQRDESLDGLLEMLKGTLSQDVQDRRVQPKETTWRDSLVSALAERIFAKLGAEPPNAASEITMVHGGACRQSSAIALPTSLLDEAAAFAQRHGKTVTQFVQEALAGQMERAPGGLRNGP